MKIQKLVGADRVRLRPAVIFGEDGASRALAMVLKVLAADPDATKLILTRHDDGSLEVTVDGQGLYLGSGEDGIWQSRFCEIPCLSAYEPHIADLESYFWADANRPFEEFDLCAVQYAAAFMDVTVCRGGLKYGLHFEKGENIGGLSVQPWDGPSGTSLRFKPDESVFGCVDISEAYIRAQLAVLQPECKFILK